MIPPKGFGKTLHPLFHRLVYGAGLSHITGNVNSTMFTLVKNYKSTVSPETLNTNPKHADFIETENGAICIPNSIIDKLKLSMTFSLTKNAVTDGFRQLKVTWFPIFFSFPEKLDAADDKTTATVKSILELTSDSVEEDVTPLWSGTKLSVVGASDRIHATSNINFNEVFGTMNLTTNTTMESVAFDSTEMFKAIRYFTNKGALKACMGRMRHITLSENHLNHNVFIDKFVPRAVRRIMPYSFFAIMAHIPLDADDESYYQSGSGTATVAHVGIKVLANYHEWNHMHEQEEM